jgi:hypothetical protein
MGATDDSCEITSQTVATQPADRTRTTIGVGEEVTLTFSKGAATWSLSGPGSFSAGLTVLASAIGETVNYMAPDVPGTATISATGGGCTNSITFTIIQPTSVTEVPVSSDVYHTQGYPDVGMITWMYVGPDSVSFYNIKCHEINCTPTVTGVYSCLANSNHDYMPETFGATTTVEAGKGTKMNTQDQVSSDHCGKAPANPSGLEMYAIPWEYQVGSGSFHSMGTVYHQVTCDSSGTVTITKAGATATTTVDAQTLEMPMPTLN